MKISKFHILTCCLIFCISEAARSGTKSSATHDPSVIMVRSSSFQKCPDVTVDQMASAFFASPVWSVTYKKGFKYVNLKGGAIFNKKTVKVLLPFKITGPNDWNLGDLEMNGVSQIPLLRAGLLDRMCESAIQAAPAAAPAPAADDAAAPAAAPGPDDAAAPATAPAPAADDAAAPAADIPPAEPPSTRKSRKSKTNRP
jgi:hypothetical protein